MPVCIKLIKLNINDEMKAQITLLLANMAGYGIVPSVACAHPLTEDCTINMIEGGAIEPIVQLLHSESSTHQHFSALALANIVVDVTTISRVLATPCVDRIVDLCYSPQPQIRRQATRILNSIASYPTGMKLRAESASSKSNAKERRRGQKVKGRRDPRTYL